MDEPGAIAAAAAGGSGSARSRDMVRAQMDETDETDEMDDHNLFHQLSLGNDLPSGMRVEHMGML